MIPAIVLAAGASSRMGRPKALLPIGRSGQTFLTHIVQSLQDGGVEHVIVVIGGDAGAVRATLHDDAFITIVENTDFATGQLSSLLVGLAAASPDAPAAMVTLVDLPLISSAIVGAVLDAYRASPDAPLVRPHRGRRRGHPVVFHRRLFAELRNADPSAGGARPVVHAHEAAEVGVEVADDGPFTDIDTPEDYERLIRPTLQ